jgi:hypothetical protein
MPAHSPSKTAAVIRRMARKYHVAYSLSRHDALAHHITRLSDDYVELDEIEKLLIALQRAGHLTRIQVTKLQASYLREARS